MKLSYVVKRFLAVFLYDQYFYYTDKSSPGVGLVPPNTNMKLYVAAVAADFHVTANNGALDIVPFDRLTTKFRVRGIALLATPPIL